ncbi:MAG: ABC transporter ATP-binding protein [Thermoleophilaceae bacterium]|nr:ABC transporter ATP-binding protein [Thermoleophilaceae bacterium]
MTATLKCTELRKSYPGQDHYALGTETSGVSFEVQKGELFALLGPSGCGKTTTLRIVGGFVEPTSGTVEIEGVDVTDRQPYERPTNTVFQSYALFPHMRLGANVAYGLKMERVPRAERDRRVKEALELVGLAGMERRRISELSGGQQQRAALARAIVKRPALLLLDEPLGALDLKLRRQMQDELVALKRSTGMTFVHVTHDQEEACAIADRIAVMDQGVIVQIDRPEDLYRAPRTSYVASFIDAGTIVRGEAKRHSDVVELAHPDLVLRGTRPAHLHDHADVAAVLPRDRVRVAMPDAVPDAANAATGTVERVIFTGSAFNVSVRVSEELEIRAALTVDEVAGLGEEVLRQDSRVAVHWAPEDVVFVQDSEAAGQGVAAGARV